MDTVKVTTGVRASYSLGEGESGAKHDCRQGRVLTSQDLVVQLLNGVNRASLETIAKSQPRVQIIGQICDDEAGLKSGREVRSGDGNQNQARVSNCQTSP